MNTDNSDNELIAEFMPDMEYVTPVNTKYKPYWRNKGTMQEFKPDALKYHTSWDWLMSVVEKIGNIMNEFEKEPFYELDEGRDILMKLGDCLCQVDIKGANIEVLNFIKWYNYQSK